MKTKIETAIKQMAGMITSDNSSLEALQFSQSVLNLTHALDIINFQASRPVPSIEPSEPPRPPNHHPVA